MVKVGYRKPSPSKALTASTKSRITRAAKKALIPGYGAKGTGWIKDPKRAAYNYVYHRTTTSAYPKAKRSSSKCSTTYETAADKAAYLNKFHGVDCYTPEMFEDDKPDNSWSTFGCVLLLVAGFSLLIILPIALLIVFLL